jgi:hypothetical protein
MHLRGKRAAKGTEIALVASIADTILLFRSEATSITIIVSIDEAEQCRKRRAQGHTLTTVLTDVVGASEFVTNICLIEILRMFGVVRNSHCFLPRKQTAEPKEIRDSSSESTAE